MVTAQDTGPTDTGTGTGAGTEAEAGAEVRPDATADPAVLAALAG